MPFNVTVEPSGHTFQVEADESVLDAALRQGIGLPYGCRNGACGSCMGTLLSGEIAYGDTLPGGISPAESDAGKALFCQARPLSDLRIQARESAAAEIAVRTLPARVAGMHKLNHDVMQLKLKLPASERLQYLAGQYLEILLKGGERRAFSMANPPHDDEFLELHIRHVAGGRFTDHVFKQMQEKALLRVEGPLGSFALDEGSTRPIIFIAGGTGFAPIKAMVEHALAEEVERPMHLYWGARDLPDLYMHALAQTWQANAPNLRYVPVLSESRQQDWPGRNGLVLDAVLDEHPNLSGFDVYASGPPPMVDGIRQHYAEQGWDQGRLFFDSFTFAHEGA